MDGEPGTGPKQAAGIGDPVHETPLLAELARYGLCLIVLVSREVPGMPPATKFGIMSVEDDVACPSPSFELRSCDGIQRIRGLGLGKLQTMTQPHWHAGRTYGVWIHYRLQFVTIIRTYLAPVKAPVLLSETALRAVHSSLRSSQRPRTKNIAKSRPSDRHLRCGRQEYP